AERDVEMPADFSEGEWVQRAVDDVGGEQPAEEHHLGHQKDPHPQCRSVALLFEVVELMRERGISCRVTVSQCRPLHAGRASGSNCALARPLASAGKSYGSPVTTGVTSKFPVGGGDDVCHSSPVEGHGLAEAFGPYRIDQIR